MQETGRVDLTVIRRQDVGFRNGLVDGAIKYLASIHLTPASGASWGVRHAWDPKSAVARVYGVLACSEGDIQRGRFRWAFGFFPLDNLPGHLLSTTKIPISDGLNFNRCPDSPVGRLWGSCLGH